MKLLLITSFLLCLTTVWIIDNRLANGVVSGKYFWFYGSMGMVSIVTFIHAFINKQSFRFSLTDGFVCCFAGSIFLSSFVFNTASANTGKFTLLTLLFVLYFSLRIAAGNGSKNLQTIFCMAIILTGLVEALWGLQQLYGWKSSQHDLFKLTGSFFNPGPYAGYLAAVFPMALYELSVQIKELRIRLTGRRMASMWQVSCSTLTFCLLALCAVIAILLVLPATMSRASWLAAMAGSFVVIVCSNRTSLITLCSKTWRIKIIAFVLLLVLLAVSAVGMYDLKKNSADGRLLTWKVSLTAVAKHPSGVGLGHFPSAYGEAQAEYFASGRASETEKYVAGNQEYGFNEYLQIAVESGIIALLLFIGVIVCAVRNLIKAKNWGVTGSLVALLVFAFFSYPFSILPFPIVLVFLLAMSVPSTQITQMGQINTDQKTKSASIRFIGVIGILLFCLSVTAGCLWKQYPVYDAYRKWSSYRWLYYQIGMYKEAMQHYEPLYPLLNDQVQFLFEYAQSLSKTGNHIQSNAVLTSAMQISCDPMLYNMIGKNHQALQEYDLAEQSLLKSTHIVPNRLYPYYLLMKLYEEKGDKVKTQEAASIVLKKEPKVQSRAVREMREEAEKLKDKTKR